MSRDLGPLEVVCDAPPYGVVRASRALGIEAPEDVRWCETERYLRERSYDHAAWRGEGWNELVERLGPRVLACPCGRRLPAVLGYRCAGGADASGLYYLGQCVRCKRVYWHKA
jgi:hypothetical protein